MFGFEINAHCANTSARCGTFETPHGPVHTPRFMPVGTLATVKGISTEQLGRTGAQMVLSNTYHLHLQPGEEIVCLLYTSPSPRDRQKSRMPSSA